MTSAAPYDATAYDDSAYLQEGDTVRCGDNPNDCRVIGTWGDWLWLHSVHPRNLAPFTSRAGACKPSRPAGRIGDAACARKSVVRRR
jgi:hypothetical protein